MGVWHNGEIGEFFALRDTAGRILNVSDGGVLYAEGKYHWYGQALGDAPYHPDGASGGQTTRTGVVMYGSENLTDWEFEGVILPVSSDPDHPLYAPMRMERPKIVYNEKTGMYVLWCHYVAYPGDHGVGVGGGEAGVAVCDRVNGRYTWVGHTRPIDGVSAVRDCTLYKDRDGTAYFVYDRDESVTLGEQKRALHIVKLSEDYLRPTREYKRIEGGFHREAPALLCRGGYYYMVTSGLTGWACNGARVLRAKSLFGEWEDMGDPCVDDREQTTFRTQTTFVFRLEGEEERFVHMAERHNTANFLHCSYVWLPLHFAEDRLFLAYEKEWEIFHK